MKNNLENKEGKEVSYGKRGSYYSFTTIDEYGTSGNDNKLFGKVGKLIKIVDDLRDLGLNEVFELPKIVVLGTQSSGKSSVLESIIGLDCLPRGSGLVTRRPLELRLCHLHYSDTRQAWAEFEEIKEEKFTDFEKVKEKINELTDKVAGKNGNIVNKPIRLKINSKTCPDLTLIDLPGITRIPLHNSDQPKNIEEITKEMATLYCQDKTTIILVVLQANVDISTSEALHMAMKLDPSGERTIGVLTKLDLMDSGTDAKGLLENTEMPLKNGYVALKNRSQQDLNDRLPIDVAIQKELLFFKSHPTYSKMTGNYFGIETLVDKLRRLFFDHLKLFLPGIYNSIKEKIHECRKTLDELGSDMIQLLDSGHGNQLNYLNQLANKFCENFEKIFIGKSTDSQENTTSHNIKIMYYNLLGELDVPPSKKIHKSFISEMLIRSEGDRISGFPEADVCHEILNTEYDNIQLEVQSFYEKIYEIVCLTANNTIEKHFKRFPPLRIKMTEIVMEYIDEKFANTKYLCNCIVSMNMNYIYIDEKGKFEETLKSILGLEDKKDQQQVQGQGQAQSKTENLQNKDTKTEPKVTTTNNSKPQPPKEYTKKETEEFYIEVKFFI